MGDIFHVTCRGPTCKLIFMKFLCHYSIRVINTTYIVWTKGSLFLRESSFQLERGGGVEGKVHHCEAYKGGRGYLHCARFVMMEVCKQLDRSTFRRSNEH